MPKLCILSFLLLARMSMEESHHVPMPLEFTHEGTNEVKETEIGLLNLDYENTKMEPDEDYVRSILDDSQWLEGLR
ncbi:hypothetical protein GQ457_06G012980 [Hibiscus cannabinus]